MKNDEKSAPKHIKQSFPLIKYNNGTFIFVYESNFQNIKKKLWKIGYE